MRARPFDRRVTVATRVARLGAGAADRELLHVLERDFVRAATTAGPWLLCAPGCEACCHGPFPITPLDSERLRRGVAELERTDPARSRIVRSRADEALLSLRPGFPGDAETGRLVGDVDRLDRFFERHARLGCPALDPRDGRCELYASRPVACRSYGPPLRFAGKDAPHCELCFRGADPATIERCRIEPDPDGLEQALLARLGVTPGGEWQTLIAFALATPAAAG